MTSSGLFAHLAVLCVWLLTSFLCHKLAKLAIDLQVNSNASRGFLMPLVVTLFQILCCCATIKVTSTKGRLFYVTAASHFLAILATNTGLGLTFASSVMTLKMLEPMILVVVQTLVLKGVVMREEVVGIIVASGGAFLYVGNPVQSGSVTRAIIMAVISNLSISLRDLATHLSQESGTRTIQFRSMLNLSGFLACLVFFLCALCFWETDSFAIPRTLTSFLVLSVMSSVCHVTCAFVSTNVLPLYMSLTNRATASVMRGVLVVLLLYVSGRRLASLWNWAGLVLCTVALLYGSRRMALSPGSSSVSNASEESQESNTVGSPTSSRAAGRLLSRLLVPLVLVYVICMASERMTSTDVQAWQPHQKLLGNNNIIVSTDSTLDYQSFHRFWNWTNEIQDIRNVTPLRRCPESILRTGVVLSKVLKSIPKHPRKSDSDYAQNLRYGYENWTDGKPLIMDNVTFQPERKPAVMIDLFLLRKHLIETPFDTDGLSPYLTDSREVIEEAIRVHSNLFQDLLRGKKYAVLFDLACHENKGDAAIGIGEFVMLERMGIKVLFYMNVFKCEDARYQEALKLSKKHHREEVVVLLSGGGNIIGYGSVDICRQKALKTFEGYHVVLFSQSIYMRASKAHFDFTRKLYCCNSNLTVILRDRLSLYIARRLFNNGTRLLLAPDMAFENGHVARYAPPYYDVIWQKRRDTEAPQIDKSPSSLFPVDVSVLVWDWISMPSLKANGTLKSAMHVLQNGLGILQQGRVLVTDRLHGHILSTLLDIPHVLLDNGQQKLSSYHNTWTRGLKNCRLADNAKDAARLALELLKEYKDSLPKRLTAVDINEHKLKG